MPTTRLNRKKLESLLQQVNSFTEPQIQFEQYPTSAQVATDILYHIQTQDGAIEGKAVADLGCGPGIFTIGSFLLGASYILAVEKETHALRDLVENLDAFDALKDRVDILQVDVTNASFFNRDKKLVDTVILNPPFGTNQSTMGMDIQFLKTALRMSPSHVYSLHKTSTRSHILKTVQSVGAQAKVVAELRFDIPRLYKRHRQASVDIEVDLVHSWF